jgi:hypothetical protein
MVAMIWLNVSIERCKMNIRQTLPFVFGLAVAAFCTGCGDEVGAGAYRLNAGSPEIGKAEQALCDPNSPCETVGGLEDVPEPPPVGKRCPVMWTCDDEHYYPARNTCRTSGCGNTCYLDFKCSPGCYCP